MFGLNAFSILVYIAITFSIFKVSRQDPKFQDKIVKLLSFTVLVINIFLFAKNPWKIPVEFSTVSYFVVPLILLMNMKRLEVWAVYSSIMSGFFYYLTMITTGGAIYNTYPYISVYTSLFCHGSLYFIGMLKLKTILYDEKKSYKIIIGNLFILAWAIYIRPDITLQSRIFIYEIIDGDLVRAFTSSYLWIYLPVYYVLLSYLVYKSSKGLYKFNKFLNQK